MKFKSLVCAITYNCNSKCSFCNIWKSRPEEEMSISYYKKLPSFDSINLTGGEPFLRKEIDEIIEILKTKTKRIVISTNGQLTDRIIKTAKKYPRLGFRVSIDGIGEKNDKMRGVPGSFERSMNTILALKKIGVKDIGICATFGKGNESQMEKIYNLAKKLNVEFLVIVRHDSFYYGKKNQSFDTSLVEDKLNWLIDKYLCSPNIKNYFRAYYTDGAIQFVKGEQRPSRCDAGFTSFYIDPKGEIFPCCVLDKRMGNIKTDKFEDISKKIKCNVPCWMPCTVNQEIKRNPLPAAKWILKKKFLK